MAVAVIGWDRFMRRWASVIISTLLEGQGFSGYSGAQKDDAVNDFEKFSGGRVVIAVQPVELKLRRRRDYAVLEGIGSQHFGRHDVPWVVY